MNRHPRLSRLAQPPSLRKLLLLLAVVVFALGWSFYAGWQLAPADPEPPSAPVVRVAPWNLAHHYVDEPVTLTGPVAGVFSHEEGVVLQFDPADPQALLVLIEHAALGAVRAAGPAGDWTGRQVRITGVPVWNQGQLVVVVSEPTQVRWIE